jgi:hypothetical protein
MRLRLHLLAATAACITAVALAPAADAAAPAADAGGPRGAHPCAVRGSHTVLQNRYVRVFSRNLEGRRRLVGCMRRTGLRHRLHSWFNCDCSASDDSAPRVWLTGRYVAINWETCDDIDPEDCRAFMKVVDARSGRVRHRYDSDVIDELILKRNGSVAFTAGVQLIRIDTTGTTVLDDGGIFVFVPQDLSTNGSTLYWTTNGQARSAPFH